MDCQLLLHYYFLIFFTVSPKSYLSCSKSRNQGITSCSLCSDDLVISKHVQKTYFSEPEALFEGGRGQKWAVPTPGFPRLSNCPLLAFEVLVHKIGEIQLEVGWWQQRQCDATAQHYVINLV